MGIISDAWVWLGLDANSKPLGAVSFIAFGVSSTLVAWTALRFTYRNNFGWKPMVIEAYENKRWPLGKVPGGKG